MISMPPYHDPAVKQQQLAQHKYIFTYLHTCIYAYIYENCGGGGKGVVGGMQQSK